jgi:chromosome segregation ATPase
MPLPVSPPGSSGDAEPKLTERVEAFQDLLQHGHVLLGEVLAFTQNAENALAQLSADQAALDTARQQVEGERQRAEAALQQVEQQRALLATMRDEMERTRREMETSHELQSASAQQLEQALAESRRQQKALETELTRYRSKKEDASQVTNRTAAFAEMQRKLTQVQAELNITRKTLDEERLRRNRALDMLGKLPATPAATPVGNPTPQS